MVTRLFVVHGMGVLHQAWVKPVEQQLAEVQGSYESVNNMSTGAADEGHGAASPASVLHPTAPCPRAQRKRVCKVDGSWRNSGRTRQGRS